MYLGCLFCLFVYVEFFRIFLKENGLCLFPCTINCQTRVKVSVVFLQGDDISDSFFLAIIAAHDELEFDAHRRAPPRLHGGCMMQAILPEFAVYPQHLHALPAYVRLCTKSPVREMTRWSMRPRRSVFKPFLRPNRSH